MLINPITTSSGYYKPAIQNLQQNRQQAVSFCGAAKPMSLDFIPSDFFIKIKGYGKSEVWVQKIIKCADAAVDDIKRGKSFDDVLKKIAKSVQVANSTSSNVSKRIHSGILRTSRKGWTNGSSEWQYIYTKYGLSGLSRYDSYEDRLDNVMRNPLDNPFVGKIGLSRVYFDDYKSIVHANHNYINNALDYVGEKYNYLTEKYLGKSLDNEDLADINDNMAEMRWILAHSTPFERGSDAISNVFMKALYKALGVKTSSPAKGVSFDLEAYCTNLFEYKEKFTKYFTREPRIFREGQMETPKAPKSLAERLTKFLNKLTKMDEE